MPVFDEGCGRAVDYWYSHTSALLLGRTAYDAFAGHWPGITDSGDRVAVQISRGTKFVATSSPIGDTRAETTTVLGEEFRDHICALKDQPGDELQVHGSIQLAAALYRPDWPTSTAS